MKFQSHKFDWITPCIDVANVAPNFVLRWQRHSCSFEFVLGSVNVPTSFGACSPRWCWNSTSLFTICSSSFVNELSFLRTYLFTTRVSAMRPQQCVFHAPGLSVPRQLGAQSLLFKRDSPRAHHLVFFVLREQWRSQTFVKFFPNFDG